MSFSISDLNFRPRFRLHTSMDSQVVETVLRHKLHEANPEGFESACVKGHLVLRIPKENRHFWSPQMDISIAPNEDGPGSIIRCLPAPVPVVWTMFMFLYALAGFAALVGLMIASSQYTLGKELWGFWLAGGALLLGILLYVVAQFGKALSVEEMKLLRRFVVEEAWPEP